MHHEALDALRKDLRSDGVDDRRAESLLFWARSLLEHSGVRDPRELGREHLDAFLADVAERHAAGAPTQKRVLEAVVRLFKATVGRAPDWLKRLVEQRSGKRMPAVLSRDEVRRLLSRLRGREWFIASLVYGTGMRLMEVLRLRVRDVDLDDDVLHVRDESGEIQRSVRIPPHLRDRLATHLEELRLAHIRDIIEGSGRVRLPRAVAEREPKLARNWHWQFLFPNLRTDASSPEEDRPDGLIDHVEPARIHRLIERAARESNIYRRVSGHVLRNSFALHMLEKGVPVRRLERILGAGRSPDEKDTEVIPASRMPPPADPSDSQPRLH
ncbi:MAG: tyrosine-type recombinase/integrase [Wenzhouxiangellaceae bacterium]|nr:tyrosine-type recombinase/integrase [Wenzhouxiangellaceae bacterium]